MKLNLALQCKSSTHAKIKLNRTIYELLQNQEALDLSQVQLNTCIHTRHGIQVVHFQPPGVRFLHNLSLFTSPRKPDPL